MSRTTSQAKALINRVMAYEENQGLVLRDEVTGLMAAANEMVKAGHALTALRGRLSDRAVVTAGSDLGSITLTVEGDAQLLNEIKRAKNKAFALANKFARKASKTL
jgi:hypothetical protein